MTALSIPSLAITIIGVAVGAALVLFVVDTARQIALREAHAAPNASET